LRVPGRGYPVFRDDARWAELIPRFATADGPGLRAIVVVVEAELVRRTCGFAVPFMDYRAERTTHAEHFGRKSDDEFRTYCEGKSYNGTSIDGLSALPLPLPPRPAQSPVRFRQSTKDTSGTGKSHPAGNGARWTLAGR
jgi:hypothetical protein